MNSLAYNVLHPQSFEVISWGIEDFKSVGSASVDLNLGSLSVLTGVNSVGKSSLIQSILMLCQSLNYRSSVNSDKSCLLLNGPLVKLGSADDVIRRGCESCCLIIEFQANPEAFESHVGLVGNETIRGKARLTFRKRASRAHGEGPDVLQLSMVSIDLDGGKPMLFELVPIDPDGLIDYGDLQKEHYKDLGGLWGEEEQERALEAVWAVRMVGEGDESVSAYVDFDGLKPYELTVIERHGDFWPDL